MPENALFLSLQAYDIHTLRKVAALHPKLGNIRIHDAEGGYLLTFTDCPHGAAQAKQSYLHYLREFTQNIWLH